jgi:peptide-methionine (R)-S-oxide reductase
MERGKLRTVIVVVWIASLLVLLAALSALAATLGRPVAQAVTTRGGAIAAQQREDKVKIDHAEMKAKLSEQQYNVCFNAATEPPFTGKYWDHHEAGAYHCVACDAPLFSSTTKFDSGTGWPSFYDAVEQGAVEQKEDNSHGMSRTEVLCGRCGAHLGHIFNDGPQPTGLRYCINSASLEFRADEDS